MISNIELWTDEAASSVVHTSLGGLIQTTGRFELIYKHGDGRELALYREHIMGKVEFVNLPDEILLEIPGDFETMLNLYNFISTKLGGVAVTWGEKWSGTDDVVDSGDEWLVKRLITAASYLNDYALTWE